MFSIQYGYHHIGSRYCAFYTGAYLSARVWAAASSSVSSSPHPSSVCLVSWPSSLASFFSFLFLTLNASVYQSCLQWLMCLSFSRAKTYRLDNPTSLLFFLPTRNLKWWLSSHVSKGNLLHTHMQYIYSIYIWCLCMCSYVCIWGTVCACAHCHQDPVTHL